MKLAVYHGNSISVPTARALVWNENKAWRIVRIDNESDAKEYASQHLQEYKFTTIEELRNSNL